MKNVTIVSEYKLEVKLHFWTGGTCRRFITAEVLIFDNKVENIMVWNRFRMGCFVAVNNIFLQNVLRCWLKISLINAFCLNRFSSSTGGTFYGPSIPITQSFWTNGLPLPIENGQATSAELHQFISKWDCSGTSPCLNMYHIRTSSWLELQLRYKGFFDILSILKVSILGKDVSKDGNNTCCW